MNIQYRISKHCDAKAILLDSHINRLRWKPFGPQWPSLPYIVTDSGWNIFGDTGGDGKGAGKDSDMPLTQSDVMLLTKMVFVESHPNECFS